ncbi:hypothetical protein [Yoonia sp.]|uniref:hypothetical protein n=1 Tax=Yoonia sp. TaxID=2212373 RepID=UPI0035C825F4
MASKKARALIAYLAQTPGKPRSREEILALLWSTRDETQGRASLRQVLTGLRRQVGKDVLRIDRESVALNADIVTLIPANGEEFLSGFHVNDPAFTDWLRDERLRLEGTTGKAALPIAPITEKPSIAVLPFENLSRDPKQDYISDGITHAIITALAKTPKLFVVAQVSTSAYKNQTIDVADISNEQGVRYVLKGSTARVGERLRITAQLIDAFSGKYIWAQRYNRVLTDIFALQDDITREVVSALQIELTEGEQAGLVARGNKNFDAWECVFQIGALLAGHRREDVLKGRELAERALKLDKNYGQASTSLGWSYIEEAFNGWSANPAKTLDLAFKAADRARQIDKKNPGAFTLLCFTELCRGNFDLARAHAEGAMRLGPNNAFAFEVAGIVGQYCNDPEYGIPHLRRSMRLSPIYPAWCAETLGWMHFLMQRHDEAIQLAHEAVAIDADYIYSYILLALAFTEIGQMEEAATATSHILRIAPDYSLKRFAETQPFQHADVMARHITGLRAAGLPE